MALIEFTEEQPVDEKILAKYSNQLLKLSQGRASKNVEPEVAIFYRKQILSRRLLKISVEDLSKAPAQSWYGEYIALLAIRIKNPALQFISREIVAELLKWYKEHFQSDERELAVLGLIQFMTPLELMVPFNQHLWHVTMRADVRAVILEQYPSVNYTDREIAAYWLHRQSTRRHESEKIRVVFIVQSRITCDKFLPVYEAMNSRDDIEAFLFLHTDTNYKHADNSWKYFRDKYPDAIIYDNCTLPDLQLLKPDYVFISNPYENRRTFPSLRVNDIVKFAKVCVISYGATLAYSFANRLFDDFPNFYGNVYMMFCSGKSIKALAEKNFSTNLNRQHFEFCGYPELKSYYQLEKSPSSKKRILWTPRWTPGSRQESRVGGSHFLAYKDKFIALTERYGGKVELYFRPHMNLFRELVRNGDMTNAEVDAYKKNLDAAHVIRHTNLADMNNSIRNVDIFLTDYSSIVIDLFLTGRPVIYCEFPEAVPLPEYKEMFAAMYIAHSWQDVERRLDDLIADKDPLFDKRQKIAAKIYETHKDATEKIIGKILRDFNANLEVGAHGKN